MEAFDVLISNIDALLDLQRNERVGNADGAIGALALGQRMQDASRSVADAINDTIRYGFPIQDTFNHKLLVDELQREIRTYNPMHLLDKASRDKAIKALEVGRAELIDQRNRHFGLPAWTDVKIQSITSMVMEQPTGTMANPKQPVPSRNWPGQLQSASVLPRAAAQHSNSRGPRTGCSR